MARERKVSRGCGYMLGVTFREDYHWLPIPMPLPVVKAGTDDVGLYMTYIPFTNVIFLLRDDCNRQSRKPTAADV